MTDGEDASAFGVLLIPNGAMMHPHQFVRQMQTDTDTVTRESTLVESLKQFLLFLLRDAHTSVLYDETQLCLVLL